MVKSLIKIKDRVAYHQGKKIPVMVAQEMIETLLRLSTEVPAATERALQGLRTQTQRVSAEAEQFAFHVRGFSALCAQQTRLGERSF